MNFEWDEEKNLANVAKHGVSFEFALKIFEGVTLTAPDMHIEHNELREISIGMVEGITVLVVIHTDRNGVCRIISARRALKKERKRYEEILRNSY